VRELPFVDRHEVAVGAAPAATWDALLRVASSSFGSAGAERFARVVGCEETARRGEPGAVGSAIVGFTVVRAEPPRLLVLEGAHRFSRYSLTVEIEPEGAGSTLAAVTHAEFPGLHGQGYRTLVVRSRIHVLVTRRLLGEVRRRAERGVQVSSPA
jgi:hypothetical protein